MAVGVAHVELRGGQPLLGGLDGVLRHADTVVVSVTQVELGNGESSLGGLPVPVDRFGIVLGHVQAEVVGLAQGELGGGVAPSSGLTKPVDGLEVVLQKAALPAEVSLAQLVFRGGVPLFRGLPETGKRLGGDPRNTATGGGRMRRHVVHGGPALFDLVPANRGVGDRLRGQENQDSKEDCTAQHALKYKKPRPVVKRAGHA